MELIFHCLFEIQYCFKLLRKLCSGALSLGSHPFSFRTRKLSPVEAMVLLWGRVARRRNIAFEVEKAPVGEFFVIIQIRIPVGAQRTLRRHDFAKSHE